MHKFLRRTAAVFSAAALLLCGGCAAGDEIEDRAIVAGAAIDRVSGGVRLTVEIADVSSGSAEKADGELHFEAEGETVSMAEQRIEEQTGKPLYWAHAQLIVLSLDLCREGIYDTVQWVMRSRTARISLPLAVSEGGAGELLKGKAEPFPVTAFGLRSLLDTAKKEGTGTDLAVYVLYDRLETTGSCALLPLLRLDGEKTVLAGSAVIDRYKYSFALDPRQTYIFNLLTSGLTDTSLCTGQRAFTVAKAGADKATENGAVNLSVTLRCALEQGADAGQEGLEALVRDFVESGARFILSLSRQYDADLLDLNALLKTDERVSPADIPVNISTDVYIYDFGQAD